MRFFFAPCLEFSLRILAMLPVASAALLVGLTATTPVQADPSANHTILVQVNEPSSGSDGAADLDGDLGTGLGEDFASQQSEPDLPPVEEITAGALLDALAQSEDGHQADALARQIQSAWNDSGSPSVNLLMRRATLAMQMQNFARALDLLDTVIALEPDFAEVWNRRATVHFMREDYTLSIADVQQVLRLEPRHFGALSGMGIMLDELGEDASAQLFLSEALKVHPFLTGARERLDAIERRLRGAPI